MVISRQMVVSKCIYVTQIVAASHRSDTARIRCPTASELSRARTRPRAFLQVPHHQDLGFFFSSPLQRREWRSFPRNFLRVGLHRFLDPIARLMDPDF